MTESVLSARKVRKRFRLREGEVLALKGLDLDVRENEFICIVGPSGCGKSTFLRMAAGLLVCYALGTVWFYYTYGVQNAMGIGSELMACVVPFILPDAVKIVLAQLLAERLQKVLKL